MSRPISTTAAGDRKRTAVDRVTHTIVGWCAVEERDWGALRGVVDQALAAGSYFSDGFSTKRCGAVA